MQLSIPRAKLGFAGGEQFGGRSEIFSDVHAESGSTMSGDTDGSIDEIVERRVTTETTRTEYLGDGTSRTALTSQFSIFPPEVLTHAQSSAQRTMTEGEYASSEGSTESEIQTDVYDKSTLVNRVRR